MKALDFSIKYGNIVRKFFNDCCEQDDTIPVHKINDITFDHNERGFELRLETQESNFNRQYNIEDDGSITPLYLGIF